jgi:hypothetical protein
MTTYRTRPRTVQAEQFNPDVQPWPVGIKQWTDPICKDTVTLFGSPREYIIVHPGDWIVDDDGERRIVRKDIFPVVYEGVGV